MQIDLNTPTTDRIEMMTALIERWVTAGEGLYDERTEEDLLAMWQHVFETVACDNVDEKDAIGFIESVATYARQDFSGEQMTDDLLEAARLHDAGRADAAYYARRIFGA